MKHFDPQVLEQVGIDILSAAGSEPDEARIVSEHLVESNLKGHDSHGIGMIPQYLRKIRDGSLVPNRPGRVVTDAGPILVYDGQRGYGLVTARIATGKGISKAREFGVAVVALRDSHHIGRIGAYGEMCADQGFVSFLFVNGTAHPPRVVPHGGRQARLATNPLCIALPGTERTPPFVLDMATTKIAMGKIRVARNKGEQLQPGWILDADGDPTTDPEVMFAAPPGVMLPFAEYKGYGLSLACEILAGVMTGGGSIQPANPQDGGFVNSMFMVIVDPARCADPSWMERELDNLIEYVKSSAPVDSANPVLIAGDPERQCRQTRMAQGIPVDAGTIGELRAAADSVGVHAKALVP